MPQTSRPVGTGFKHGLYNVNADGTYQRVFDENGKPVVTQGDPSTASVTATLTAAQLQAGILTVNQAGAAATSLTLPLGADMDTAFGSLNEDDAIDFSVINVSTVAAEDATILTNTGWTLVGSMVVASNAAATDKSSGLFRARKTGDGTYTLYRLA